MLSKGRKLVDLVNRSDKNKTASQDLPTTVFSQKTELKKTPHTVKNEKSGMSLPDICESQHENENRNLTEPLTNELLAANKVSVSVAPTPRKKVVKNLNSLFDKISNENVADSKVSVQNPSPSLDRISTVSQAIVPESNDNTSLENINNYDKSASALTAQASPKIHAYSETDITISGPLNAIQRQNDPSQPVTTKTGEDHDVVSLQNIDFTLEVTDSNHYKSYEYSFPSILCKNVEELEEPPLAELNESGPLSPQPRTSTGISKNQRQNDPSQSTTTNAGEHHDVVYLQNVDLTFEVADSNHHQSNNNRSPSILCKNVKDLEEPPLAELNESGPLSPQPCTSTGIRKNTLHEDLYLSSDDELSPYIDSESSFCPTPTKRIRLPLSLDSDITDISDSAEVARENLPKRRKKAMPETWKRNVLKNLRQTGKGYVNRSGKYMQPKKPKPTDCTKCRFRCNSLFPENLRQDIFEDYWSLADTKQQKMMLSSLITHTEVLRLYTKAKKNRTMSRQYWLFHLSVGRKRVCQKIFCNTFNISSSIINDCSKNIGFNGIFTGTDKRQGKLPANITSVESINFVKMHIDQYPRVESHYCRKDSKKVYLDSDLNISRLYRIYKENFCLEKNITPVSPYVYQKIFHSYSPRLSFYKPKKDQCTKCNVYKRTENKDPLQVEYDAHKKREYDALAMKKEDKQRCLDSDGAFRAITFDLQAILSVPFTGDCKIYYLRKLSLYNLTFLDSHENTGNCYLWDECNGKKGFIEIGSILLKYLFSLPETVTHVSSFSDTCGGQNRNKYVTLAALYAVINVQHLETIDLKFMESGHSYLEVDSIHACIERARKHKSIFTLREYALVIGTARIKPKPYNVIIMKHGEFYDLKLLEKLLNPNTNKNTENEPVQWLKIKWLQVKKEYPTSIFYKYDLTEPHFKEIDICKSKTMKRNRDICIRKFKKPLKGAYKSQIPISEIKKKDLLSLLKDGVIPSEYDQYYKDIQSTSMAIVNNNCSDSESSNEDDGPISEEI